MSKKHWADDKDLPPFQEFICSAIAGTIATLAGIGWIFLACGMNVYTALGICTGCGIAFAIYMARNSRSDT